MSHEWEDSPEAEQMREQMERDAQQDAWDLQFEDQRSIEEPVPPSTEEPPR